MHPDYDVYISILSNVMGKVNIFIRNYLENK